MKKITLSIVLGLLFLILFNVLFFVLRGTDNITIVWISYGFIHFAYLFVLATPLFTAKTQREVLNYTLWSQSITYFILELLVGIGFIAYATYGDLESVTWSLIIQATMCAIFLFIFIANIIANDHTNARIEERTAIKDSIMNTADNIRPLISRCVDSDVKKKVERCYDAMRYSPVRSHPSIIDIEYDIRSAIDALESSLAEGSKEDQLKSATELLRLIDERKNKLKYIH